jgi:hypothetical protein
MTAEEKRAIANMRRAIASAHKLGIRLAGMDGGLLYATASALEIGEVDQARVEKVLGTCYSSVAHAVQACLDDNAGLLDDECYEDSGGW